MTRAKRIIEQETQTSGDIWRALNGQTREVASAVQNLKSLVPGFEEALDSIVAAHKAKVDQAALAVKKTKVEAPNKMVSSVLSGDPFGEKKDLTPVKKLLKAINALGWKPKFVLSQGFEVDPEDLFGLDVSDLAQSLNEYYDLEVDPEDLVKFTFTRDSDNRSELVYIEGAILPNGQVYIETVSSDRVSHGPLDLFDNAKELVDNINQIWL
jgi:hypothetical protein